MKGREVGYVLLALIILGVAGVIVKLVTTGNNDQTLTGLLPLPSLIDLYFIIKASYS